MSKTLIRIALPALSALLLFAPAARGEEETLAKPKPPVAPEVPHEETAFGETREDPYHWLREREDPRVRAYLEAENAYTEAVLAPVAKLREALYEEIVARIREDDETVPHPDGPFLYWTRTEKGKQYPIHLRRPSQGDGEAQVVLDENALAEGHGFLDVGDLEPSPDHTRIAYTIDTEGAERYTLRIQDLATGKVLPDTATDVSDVVWVDDQTLLYTVLDETNRPYRVHRHRIGAKGPDPVVHDEQDDAFYVDVSRTRSGAFVLIGIGSQDTTEVRALDTKTPDAAPFVIQQRVDGIEYSVDHHAAHFYIVTNEDAVGFKLVRKGVPTKDAAPSPVEEVRPHREGTTLEGLSCFARFMVLIERTAGQRQLRVMAETADGGREEHLVQLPEAAYSIDLGPNEVYDTALLRIEYESLVTPPTVYDYDVAKRSLALKKRDEVKGYDPSGFTTERIWAKSADDVLVPISLVCPKGLARDGKAPLYLYGYGAYGSPMDPYFSAARVSLLQRGFAFAIAHVRGGGDLGRPWYDDGKLENKQNSFTDLAACAARLIEAKLTSADRLVVSGGSAGGLLVGATVNQHPELFGVAILDVPFVDALNTMSDPSLPLTVVEYDEWGDPSEEEAYKRIRAYSPYDNIAAQAYPHMLVTAGLNDTRVGYWEPAKWVARLRTTKTDDHTLLLKVDLGAGHGGASGRYDAIKERALEYAFVLFVLGRTG